MTRKFEGDTLVVATHNKGKLERDHRTSPRPLWG